MTDPISFPSVRTIKPPDQGGPIARQGFSYQDDIAIWFVLSMLSDARLVEIWCETQDDIVLIWSDASGSELVEYIQVKTGNSEKLWSIADLCKRKAKESAGTSLFERSLSRDCCSEQSLFAIVTRVPVVPELAVLTYPVASPGRATNQAKIETIAKEISEKFPSIKSTKGNGVTFWIQNCRWIVAHDAAAVENSNLIAIASAAEHDGVQLFPEQAKAILKDLRSMVKTASDAPWDPDPNVKRLLRTTMLDWWKGRLKQMTQAGERASSRLYEKMAKAKLSEEQIRLAGELRRKYTSTLRARRYMDEDDIADLQQNVRAELMSLGSQFLAGDLPVSASQFHAHCVAMISALDNSRPPGAPSRRALLLGCMYDITDRCLHRFDRQESV